MRLVSIQLLLSVIVASATVSTAVATGVTLWLRFRERPEPDWVVSAYAARSNGSRGGVPITELNVYGRLTNVGDGNAFRVTLEAPRAQNVGLIDRSGPIRGIATRARHLALSSPGDEAEWGLNCEPEQWDDVEIVLAWTISPTRKGKRRKQTFRLSDLAERPAAEVKAPEEPAGG